MKAIRMYAPRDLRLEQVPIPEIKENEVLVKIMAVGICGSDIPRINQYGAHISPIIPGHEFSGVIVETGKGILNFKIDDRVTVPPILPCFECGFCEQGHYSLCRNYKYFGSRNDGAFAQYIAVPETNLLKIADNVTYEAAATTDPLANALHAISRGGFKAGDKVCVFGAGAIGLYAIQYMNAKGAEIAVAVDVNERKLEVARNCGADVTIDGRLENIVEKIVEATDGGADVCIDASGFPTAQHNAIMSTAKHGTMVLLGISHQPLTLSEECIDWVMRGEKAIVGSWNSFSKPFPGWEWELAVKALADGTIDADKVITHKLPLEDAPEIFDQIYKKELFFNKVLFLPWME
ncbi:MAG TPA: galactitol-1-phosphate 5-dehydrogenase [Negativicutes bacterium]|nr:galactitol-1-phosphate 5-dehydrogenase [Negativicutes bacterium]